MKNNLLTLSIIVKQLWKILNNEQKKKSLTAFAWIIISSIFEVLGISAIIPFIYAIDDTDKLMQNKYILCISNLFGITKRSQIILLCGGGIFLIYVIKNIILIISAHIQISFRCTVERDLSVSMLNAYLKRPYSFFLDNNSAEIMRGIGTDIGGVFFSLDYLFNILSQGLTFLLIGGFIIYVDWFMSLGIIIIALLSIIVIIYGLKDKMRDMGLQFREADKIKTQAAIQAIQGIKEISVMQRKDYFKKKYKMAYDKLVYSNFMKTFLVKLPDRIVELLFVLGIIGIICIRVWFTGELKAMVPILGAFAMAAYRLLPSVSVIANSFSSLTYYRPSVQNTYDNLIAVRENEIYDINDKREKNYNINVFKNEICINNIKWRYANTEADVICNLSMKIYKGESVAFIGESGAGKSTLSDIILGLLKPQQGEVLVDGIDIFSIPLQWSRMIGYVPQSVYLLDDTIRANVAFGIDDNKIDDNKVWDALEEAQLKEYIEKLPDKLGTIVGERGVKLSGGQRQRIAIARALYYNPCILILDEATSALDDGTEAAVMEAIERLHGQKTLIIIAHRLSTIKNCDRVYEIKDGIANIVKNGFEERNEKKYSR